MPHFPCPVDRNKGNRIGTTFSLQTFVTPCHTSGIRLAFGQLVMDHKSENPASGAGFSVYFWSLRRGGQIGCS